MLSIGTSFGSVALRSRQKDTAGHCPPVRRPATARRHLDTDWIPSSGVGWVVINSDRHLRTRPVEAELAHKLKVVHLHGPCGRTDRVGTADAAAAAVTAVSTQ